MMDRREALSVVSALFGGTVVGASAFLGGCEPSRQPPLRGLLNIDDKLLVDEIGETILPWTENSPGAGELKIGTFINTIISDCYSTEEQAVFLDGLRELNETCRTKFGKEYRNLNTEKRHAVLDLLEKESGHAGNTGGIIHFYLMLKQLIIWAYLSSRKVSVEVLGYVPVPGRYEGCLPFKAGEKAVM